MPLTPTILRPARGVGGLILTAHHGFLLPVEPRIFPIMTTRAEIKNSAYELVPCSQLHEHPRNHRHGNTEEIAKSIEQNGFFGACVAQMSFRQLLAIVWADSRIKFSPSRLWCFAYAGERDSKGRWTQYLDDRGLPYLVFRPNMTTDFFTKVPS